MSRATRIGCLAFVAGASTGAGIASAATRGEHRVVFPHRIGAYEIGGTYREAVVAFGRPSAFRRRYGGICELTWTKQGLRLYFRNVYTSPCTHRGLTRARFTKAKILSPRWSV